ncbi:MAG: undecaprenyl-diphosphate phosphatase [bacterium]
MNFLWLVVAVQIIAESLPISSSSHVRIIELFFLSAQQLQTLPAYFDHLLHGPTVLIVMIFFVREWFRPFRLLWLGFIEFFRRGRMRDSLRRLCMIFFRLVGLVVVCSVLPIFMMYGVIKPVLAHSEWFASVWLVVIGLMITSALLVSLRFVPLFVGRGPASMVRSPVTIFSATTLGVVQAIALFPGISRFASTFVAARWLGFTPRRAFQVCFLIEFPLIVAGFGINGIGGLLHTSGWTVLFSWDVVGAIVVSTVLAYICLGFAKWMAHTGRLWWFGLYVWIPILLLTIPTIIGIVGR